MALGRGPTVGEVWVKANLDSSGIPGQVRRELEKDAAAMDDLGDSFDHADSSSRGFREGLDELALGNRNARNSLRETDDEVKRNRSAWADLRTAMQRTHPTMFQVSKDGELIRRNLERTRTELRRTNRDSDLARKGFRGLEGALRGMQNVPGLKWGNEVANGLERVQRVLGGGIGGGGGGGGGLIAAFSKFGNIAASGVAGFGVLSAGILALAHALNMLAAAGTALISAGVFGAIGAIGAAAPLMVAAASGMGVFALAIHGLSQASKDSQKELTAANSAVDKAKLTLKEATPGTKAYAQAQKDLTQALKDRKVAQENANQGLGKITQTVKNYGKELSAVAAQHVFQNFKAEWATAKPALDGLKTSVAGIGDALSHVMDGFAKMLGGPSFQKFQTQFNKQMPGIVESLGNSFTNAFSGMAGVFRQLLPYGRQLANALERMTKNFADWANSARGQSAMHTFMAKAYDDAKKLWGIIKDVGSILRTVFTAGQPVGTHFLDDILGAFDKLDSYLKSGVGQAALKSWFDRSETFMTNFVNNIKTTWHTITTILHATSPVGTAIFDLIKSLDIGDILNILKDAAAGAGAVLGTLAKGAQAVADALTPLISFMADHSGTVKVFAAGLTTLWAAFKGWTIIKTVSSAITGFAARGGALDTLRLRAAYAGDALRAAPAGVGTAFTNMQNTLRSSATRVTGFFNTMKANVGTAMRGVGSAILGAGIGTAIGRMQTDASGLSQTLGALGSTAAGAMAGFAVGGPVGALIGGATGLIGDLAGALGDASQAEKEFSGGVDAATASLQANNGVIDENIRKQVEQTLQTNGTYEAAKQQGIAMDLVTRAALGQQPAINELNKELEAQRQGLDNVNESQAANIKGGQMFQSTNNDAAAATAKNNEELDKQRANLDNIDNAYSKFSGKLKDQIAKSNELNAIDKKVTQQMANHGKTIMSVADSTKEFTGKLKDLSQSAKTNGTALDGNTTAAKNNRAAVRDAVSAIRDHITALQNQGVGAKQAKDALDQDVQSLRDTAREAGFSRDEIQKLVDKLLGVPKDVHTKVSVDSSQAMGELKSITQYMQTIDGKTVMVKVDSEYIGQGITIPIFKTPTTSHPGVGYMRTGGWMPEGAVVVGEGGPEVLFRSGSKVGVLSNRDASKFVQNAGLSTAPGDPAGLLRELRKAEALALNSTPRVQQQITVNVYPQSADPGAAAQQVINKMVALTRM